MYVLAEIATNAPDILIRVNFLLCFFEGCFDNYTVIGPYFKGEGVFFNATVTEGQCQSLCNANGSCHGFHHNSTSDLCELTVGYNSILSLSSGSGSYFHMRHCPKGNIKDISPSQVNIIIN